ncbi:MAG: acetolactate synthase [Methanomassiliicoccales archaeon]
MQVMSMVVNDEFGVMQRILQEFTRRKINVETIVVGKCEIPGKARVVLTIVDRVQAERSVEALSRLHDIIQCELVDETRQESYALASNSSGKVRLIGSIEEVDLMIENAKPDKFIKAVNAI